MRHSARALQHPLGQRIGAHAIGRHHGAGRGHLPTPAWRQVHSAAQTREAFEALGSPMIVKPVREGSTIGLSKVTSPEQCDAAYALAAEGQHGVENLLDIFAKEMRVAMTLTGVTSIAQIDRTTLV